MTENKVINLEEIRKQIQNKPSIPSNTSPISKLPQNEVELSASQFHPQDSETPNSKLQYSVSVKVADHNRLTPEELAEIERLPEVQRF